MTQKVVRSEDWQSYQLPITNYQLPILESRFLMRNRDSVAIAYFSVKE